jgi:(1->4)-alpha-D-glucan 1-alpha-D-glucosylmutase
VQVVLDAQHYRLAGWRDRDSVLNYRRFFDVDTLVAIRVEEEDVFDATHALLLDLNHRGLVEGFRIDHPDGLADPGGYLERLRSRVRPGTGLWVEKILEGSEVLPDWPCDGTTGYDAALAVSAGLAERAIAPALTDAWEATGGEPSLGAVLDGSKRLIVSEVLVPERARLLRRAREALPGADAGRLGSAVDELLVSCTVYRAYVGPGEEPDELALQRIDGAFDRARTARPDLADELQQLATVTTEPAKATDPTAAHDFAVRLQQTWGPVMAKGIEDTAFYRWHRLVALNEVGGDPEMLDDAAPERMHAWADHQQRHWPLGMTTLSTHDTKRSEDVRARLLAVAGDAESWHVCTEAFADEAAKRHIDGPTAHLLWQTLIGTGDIDEERLTTYLTKAMREAKEHTSWLDPDPEYESRVIGLALDATTPGSLHSLVRTALDHNRDAVRAVVLGQKLLQLTLPGVPDTYQGCELVDLSLVDPDNRRPVDFDDRRARLDRLRDQPPSDLDDEKLLVTHRALALRKDLPDSFGERGEYHPLAGTSRHLVGFLRGTEVATLVTRGPRRLQESGGWGEATVRLPEGLWRDELTEQMLGGAENLCRDVFATYPVALLRKVHLT